MGEMLGIDGEQMRTWLCNRKIITANETLIKPLTLSQVSNRPNDILHNSVVFEAGICHALHVWPWPYT